MKASPLKFTINIHSYVVWTQPRIHYFHVSTLMTYSSCNLSVFPLHCRLLPIVATIYHCIHDSHIHSYLLSTNKSCSCYMCALLLYLIATATIAFSKQKDAATKQGQALNLCRIPKQWHLYGTYVSDVTATN